MKAILSYPYSGALYWWFDQERAHPMSKHPEHPYYRALIGDVDRNLDVALACALIYEEFVIPAADAVHPGMGDLQHLSPGDLGLEVSSWDIMREAQKLIDPVAEDWREDEAFGQLFHGWDRSDVQLELHYAAADGLLAREYGAPVLCSDGRRATVRRLIELGIVPVSPSVTAAFNADRSVDQLVDSYSKVTGLAFKTDDVRQFADLKWASPLRGYADEFQRVLSNPDMKSTDDLYAAIAHAMEKEALAEHVKGAFEATGHVMDLAGLVPAVGSVSGLIGMGADAGAAAAAHRAEQARWFELTGAVLTFRSRQAIEERLRAEGWR